jgi:hypothetical protein
LNGIVNALLSVVAGILAGLASAVAAIELYSATAVAPESPWLSWDISADSKVRPYALDHYLMAGRFPPAAGQMREFSAQKASDGSALDGTCGYTLTVSPAPALWWTMSVSSSGSTGIAPNAVITADTAIAENDGSLRIAVSRMPVSGNWIRPPSTNDFTLLYMIAEPSSNFSRGPLPMFTIERSGC